MTSSEDIICQNNIVKITCTCMQCDTDLQDQRQLCLYIKAKKFSV